MGLWDTTNLLDNAYISNANTIDGVCSLKNNGLSLLAGGLTVTGTVTLPSASIADSALSGNVVLDNSSNTFTAVQYFDAFLSAQATTGAVFVAKKNTAGDVGEVSVSGAGELFYYNGTIAEATWVLKPDGSLLITGGMTATHPGQTINFGSNIPTSSGTPSTDYQLINKAYADAHYHPSGGSYVDLTTDQTVAGVKTFTSEFKPSNVLQSGTLTFSATTGNLIKGNNTSSTDYFYLKSNGEIGFAIPGGNGFNWLISSSGNAKFKSDTNAFKFWEFAGRYLRYYNLGSTYTINIDGEVGNITLPGLLTVGNGITATATQTINFGANIPTSSGTPTLGTQLINKAYGDANYHPIGSYVNTTTNQTVGGVKTFTSLPVCSVVPTTASQLVNKIFVDTNFMDVFSDENIDGIKTFFHLNPTNSSGSTICIGLDIDIGGSNSIFIGSNQTLLNGGDATINCISIGGLSLSNAISNANCVAIGTSSLRSSTNNQYATAIGANCCDQGNPSDVVSIGSNCARYLNISDNNVFIGNGCFPVGTKASQFTAIGSGALYSYSSTGGDICNTAIGSFALASLVSGSNNAGVGSGAGGGLQTNCDYNFSAGSQSMSTAYTAPITQQQYTGVSTPVPSTTYTLGANANIKAGQLCVANFAGVASRTTVVSWNGSTLTLLNAVQMTQNSYFYFYPYGTLITTGSYAGATATSTSFTISTGLTSAIVGERCIYRSSATQTNYATVNLYSPATGVIVFTTSITLFGSSTLEFWNNIKLIGDNVDNLTALGAFSIQNFTSNASFNTGFGAYSLNGGPGGYDGISYLSGNNNSAFGNGAGKILSGSSSKNTFLGAGADVASRDLNYIQHSTAVGADSKIDRSNQVKLGTTADTITVDGVLECIF